MKYRVPSNTAVKLYCHKTHISKVVFGAALILLGPNQQFTLTSNLKKSFLMHIGPKVTGDVIEIETADHCKLSL